MNQMMPIFKKEAEGLASLGRYGDSYMVHAAEGETVIPGEILDANPGLKEQLFRQMQMMGIENPNRYVVGSALNSLNPITGQPEFFWKKLLYFMKLVSLISKNVELPKLLKLKKSCQDSS